MKKHYIAVDCGSSNGKLIDVGFDGERITIEDSKPFFYAPVTMLNEVYINWTQIMYHTQISLAELVAQDGKGNIAGIGSTTWGAEHILIDKNGHMLQQMISNRDRGTIDTIKKVEKMISSREFFYQTGSPLKTFSTPVELYQDKIKHQAAYDNAAKLIPTPNTITYFLSGEIATDETMASAMSFTNLDGTAVNKEVLKKIDDLREDLFPTIVKPGTKLGKLAPMVGNLVGDPDIDVFTCAGHDTPSGLVPIKGLDDETVFVSMGTMMLVGGETKQGEYNEGIFTNGLRSVRTVEGYTSYKDNQGFWILNRCMDSFRTHGYDVTFNGLEAEARKLPKGRCIINLNDLLFYYGDSDMVERIKKFCTATGQYVPETPAEVYRCVIDSYAVAARNTINEYCTYSNKTPKRIKLFNGGCQCDLLSETISEATGLPIEAGVRYATALGAALLQMLGSGDFANITELKEASSRSFGMKDLSRPKDDMWDGLAAKEVEFRSHDYSNL